MNADTLSRLPCRQCGRDNHMSSPGLVAATSLQPPQEESDVGLCDAQLADSILGPLLWGKETNKKPNIQDLGSVSQASHHLLQIWDQLTVTNRVLHRRPSYPDLYKRKCLLNFMQVL